MKKNHKNMSQKDCFNITISATQWIQLLSGKTHSFAASRCKWLCSADPPGSFSKISSTPVCVSTLASENYESNVGKTIPRSSPYIVGINHAQSWVVYGIVLPTLLASQTEISTPAWKKGQWIEYSENHWSWCSVVFSFQQKSMKNSLHPGVLISI